MGHTLCMLQNAIFKKTAESARSTQLLNFKKEKVTKLELLKKFILKAVFPFFLINLPITSVLIHFYSILSKTRLIILIKVFSSKFPLRVNPRNILSQIHETEIIISQTLPLFNIPRDQQEI